MARKSYEVLEHTADIGVRVKAKDLESLFKKTAAAMFELIAEKQKKITHLKKISLEVEGENLEELLIGWLNELLYQFATKDRVFSKYRIKELSLKYLSADCFGASNKNYKVNLEIKAATYHQLKIKNTASGFEAEVIFDV